jgi:hypothetical protein
MSTGCFFKSGAAVVLLALLAGAVTGCAVESSEPAPSSEGGGDARLANVAGENTTEDGPAATGETLLVATGGSIGSGATGTGDLDLRRAEGGEGLEGTAPGSPIRSFDNPGPIPWRGPGR